MHRFNVAFLVAVVLCGSCACEFGVKHLPAAIDVNSVVVKVTNNDHQDWHNVRVRVNDKYACPVVDTIEQGKDTTVKLAGCVADDGERFQPLRTAAVSIRVAAIQVDDTGEAISTFR
jgi:predicted metal-dependent phosphotriesterase family hydrolase